MHVLIDHGEYEHRNRGDLAMLLTVVERISQQRPDARIEVLTVDPPLLCAYVPGVQPVSGGGVRWAPSLHARWTARGGPAAVGRALQIRSAVQQLGHRPARSGADTAPASTGRASQVLDGVDLVVANGGGYLADVDRLQATRTLDLLEQAAGLGIPTAMLGQGLGPLTTPELMERARAVLPRVDLVALRESRRGPGLLRSLGVDGSRVLVTGDDAVELAMRNRSTAPGTQIGVCARATAYAPVEPVTWVHVRAGLQAAAREHGAGLRPLAVSEYRSEDRRATAVLVRGYRDVGRPLTAFAGVEPLLRGVAGCRVVVTGAYHLAVFALSQGIPVVSLLTSTYSEDKMRGLEEQFGLGMTHVDVAADDDLRVAVRRAVLGAWESAGEVREPLLAAARQQVRASRAALSRALDLVPAPALEDAGPS